MSPAEWLTAEEVARELKLFTPGGEPNIDQVRLLARRGELAGTKVSRFWRFRRDRVEAYLERNTVMDSYQRAAINAAARNRRAS